MNAPNKPLIPFTPAELRLARVRVGPLRSLRFDQLNTGVSTMLQSGVRPVPASRACA